MIRKLQRRFIRLALSVLALAMILVLVTVNLSNWISVRRELLDTVSLIAHSALAQDVPERENASGALNSAVTEASETVPPQRRGQSGNVPPEARERLDRDRHARNMVNESSWFSVREEENGALSVMNIQRFSESDSLEETELLALGQQALATGKDSGFLGEYAWQVLRPGTDERVVFFLNCETRLTAVRTLLLISLLACAGSILLAWLLVTLFSRKAVEPTLRNMEQQKRFITDASHELKTPLTVISTNMELLQMESPDNPWVRSTQKQASVLRRLVDELVYLSRMEEENPTLTMEPLCLSALLQETAEPFQAMAEFQGRELQMETRGENWISGDRASVQRMLSTLCDNAVKYAAGDGPILLSLRPEGRSVLLTVSNPVETPLTPEQCARLFDRFYRADPSRSKEKTSGFGIGLAIAAAVAEKHGGRLSAAMEGDTRLTITCRLPRGNAPDPKGGTPA